MDEQFTVGQKVKCGGIECILREIDGEVVTLEQPSGATFITTIDLIKPA